MSQPIPPEYPPMNAYPPPAQQPLPRRTGAMTVLAMVVLLLAIAIIINESVLKIRNIAVVGNQRFSFQQVVEAAGLGQSVSYFSVTEEKIASSLRSNRYLIFQGMEKEFPNRLTLYVRERTPAARLQEMSADYVLDQEGMVLEQKGLTVEEIDPGLMVITGLKIKDVQVGQIMTLTSLKQLEAYRAVLSEVLLQGIGGELAELNLTDPDNLYLTYADGYTAHLGGPDQLRAKIGTVRAVVSYLRQEGKEGGMLEANIPGEIIYSPASP